MEEGGAVLRQGEGGAMAGSYEVDTPRLMHDAVIMVSTQARRFPARGGIKRQRSSSS